MKTHVNGVRADWPAEVVKLWQSEVVPLIGDDRRVWMANYFTPRPYRDEWNRATEEHGFIYCIGKEVWEWSEKMRARDTAPMEAVST